VTARRSFAELVELIARLRGDNGCPWDRAQDHRSLRPYVVEEAYELVAAIDADDPRALVDELGDVLLQVLLHSQIEAEAGRASIDDVLAVLHAKLVRRHPHVFADASRDIPSIASRWQEIKSEEKAPRHEVATLVRARKLAARLLSGPRTVCGDKATELRHGERILEAMVEAVREGADPDLSLRRAMDAADERLDRGGE